MPSPTRPTMAYAARHSCGLIVAAVVDDPDQRRMVAQHTGSWIRRGDQIERMEIDRVKAETWCTCWAVTPK